MKTGYAYVYYGPYWSWSYSSDEEWAIEIVSASEAEERIGERMIDGALYVVFRLKDGGYAAQLKTLVG